MQTQYFYSKTPGVQKTLEEFNLWRHNSLVFTDREIGNYFMNCETSGPHILIKEIREPQYILVVPKSGFF